MKWFDYYLQQQRIKKVAPFIKPNATILDIGSNDGALFRYLLEKKIPFYGTGIDPTLAQDEITPHCTLIKDSFPSARAGSKTYTLITLMAVLEHIPDYELENFVSNCYTTLDSGGKIAITVPSPRVDVILAVLKALKIIDGMELEEHHFFDVKQTRLIFEKAGFKLDTHNTFQLGLNNLYVFTK